jgi:hypothetical protein
VTFDTDEAETVVKKIRKLRRSKTVPEIVRLNAETDASAPSPWRCHRAALATDVVLELGNQRQDAHHQLTSPGRQLE